MYLRATALIFCLFGISYGEEITVPASKDNTLYESSDGSLSNGVGFYLFAGATAANGNRRALLYFDLSDVPAGSTVHSAVLQLHMDKSNAGSTLVSAHRLRSNWGEGNSAGTRGEGLGAGAASSDATWLHTFYPDEFWLTSGGDYETQPSAAQTVDGRGDYQWEGDALSADVQYWIDHETENFGWVLIGDESQTPTSKRFVSHDYADPQLHPRLQIDFTPPSVSRLTGDFNGDARVDLADFFLFADHFGLSDSAPRWNPTYDLDASGRIDFEDFFVFADHFGARE